jgi:GT2 family glycosyltransferase
MVTVVVLTRNRRKLLEKCLETLMAQDCAPLAYEVVVLDDGSEDDTRVVVGVLTRRHANLRYVYQPHRGIPAARNRGLAEARGGLVAFVADDYEMAPDYVSTVRRLFEERPETKVVRFKVVSAGKGFSDRVGHMYYSFSVLQRLLPASADRLGFLDRLRMVARYREEATTNHNLEAAGGAAYRREVFDVAGKFDESLLRGEDSDFAARLRRHGIPILYYPFHCIRRHYESYFREALAKSFLAGMNRYRYHRKHQSGSGAVVVVGKLFAIAAALVYSGHTGHLRGFILNYPWLTLLEAANKLGFLAAAIKRS